MQSFLALTGIIKNVLDWSSSSKHDSGNIILVIDNRMSVTRANSFQQLNEPPVPVLNLTKVHEFLDDCRSDLDLQKFHVIVYQSDDRVFGTMLLASLVDIA